MSAPSAQETQTPGPPGSDPLRVGIAGLGTVGSEVCRILQDHRDQLIDRAGRAIDIVAVCARDRLKPRGVDLLGYDWVEDPVALAARDDIDVFVELIGGDDGPAKRAVERALNRGTPVVTANKALLAAHGVGLATLAAQSNAALGFEAAVAGGIPLIKTVREALAGNRIGHIYGILNGTCNYILSEMTETGRPYAEVLREAQEKGYAEADPAFDVGGQDAAHKLAILATLAFGIRVTIHDFHVEGIEAVRAEDVQAANELGYTIKLLALAQTTRDGEVDLRVHPAMVETERRIAKVSGVTNAAMIDAEPVGRLVLEGPGAGGGATASAVVADIVDLARGFAQPVLGRPVSAVRDPHLTPIDALNSEYYLRLTARDEAGVLASIADVLADHDISLETIIQRGAHQDGTAAIIVVTHECRESVMQHALETLSQVKGLVDKPHVIRITQL